MSPIRVSSVEVSRGRKSINALGKEGARSGPENGTSVPFVAIRSVWRLECQKMVRISKWAYTMCNNVILSWLWCLGTMGNDF